MKKYLVSIISIGMSVLCFILFSVIGSEVLADGTLREPFFLIPIAYLFITIAVVSMIIVFIKNKNYKKIIK